MQDLAEKMKDSAFYATCVSAAIIIISAGFPDLIPKKLTYLANGAILPNVITTVGTANALSLATNPMGQSLKTVGGVTMTGSSAVDLIPQGLGLIVPTMISTIPEQENSQDKIIYTFLGAILATIGPLLYQRKIFDEKLEEILDVFLRSLKTRNINSEETFVKLKEGLKNRTLYNNLRNNIEGVYLSEDDFNIIITRLCDLYSDNHR